MTSMRTTFAIFQAKLSVSLRELAKAPLVSTDAGMATKRDYLQLENWNKQVGRALFVTPELNKQSYGPPNPSDGYHSPIWIDSNPRYYVQMKRENAHSYYTVGINHQNNHFRNNPIQIPTRSGLSLFVDPIVADMRVRELTEASNDPYSAIDTTVGPPRRNPFHRSVDDFGGY